MFAAVTDCASTVRMLDCLLTDLLALYMQSKRACTHTGNGSTVIMS